MDFAEAADSLLDMRRTGRIEPDLPEGLRPIDLPEAYGIQALVVDGVLPTGAEPIGYKCACTSEIAQQALRIDRPVYGRLLSHTTSPTGVELTAARFTHRVIEAEFGFRMAQDVPGRAGGHTAESITPYVEAVIPAIEIVDYRYADWTVGALGDRRRQRHPRLVDRRRPGDELARHRSQRNQGDGAVQRRGGHRRLRSQRP